MPSYDTRWTVEQLLDLPDDGKRREIVDGALFVSPSPRFVHQRACDELLYRLMSYCHPRRIGIALTSPADIVLDDRTLVQPDVFVSELVEGRQPERWSEVTLKLAAEVLSPSSFHWDAEVKRRRLQRAGVPEFWVVDVDARSVTVWHPADGRGEVMSRQLVWAPVVGVEPLVIDLPEYFAVVKGER